MKTASGHILVVVANIQLRTLTLVCFRVAIINVVKQCASDCMYGMASQKIKYYYVELFSVCCCMLTLRAC